MTVVRWRTAVARARQSETRPQEALQTRSQTIREIPNCVVTGANGNLRFPHTQSVLTNLLRLPPASALRPYAGHHQS